MTFFSFKPWLYTLYHDGRLERLERFSLRPRVVSCTCTTDVRHSGTTPIEPSEQAIRGFGWLTEACCPGPLNSTRGMR